MKFNIPTFLTVYILISNATAFEITVYDEIHNNEKCFQQRLGLFNKVADDANPTFLLVDGFIFHLKLTDSNKQDISKKTSGGMSGLDDEKTRFIGDISRCYYHALNEYVQWAPNPHWEPQNVRGQIQEFCDSIQKKENQNLWHSFTETDDSNSNFCERYSESEIPQKEILKQDLAYIKKFKEFTIAKLITPMETTKVNYLKKDFLENEKKFYLGWKNFFDYQEVAEDPAAFNDLILYTIILRNDLWLDRVQSVITYLQKNPNRSQNISILVGAGHVHNLKELFQSSSRRAFFSTMNIKYAKPCYE